MMGLPLWAAILLSVLVLSALVGMLIERVAYRRLLVRNVPPEYRC